MASEISRFTGRLDGAKKTLFLSLYRLCPRVRVRAGAFSKLFPLCLSCRFGCGFCVWKRATAVV
jgi:hypothetical protein